VTEHLTNLEDAQLVKSLKKGDLKAYDKLYRKYSRKLLYFILSFVNSNADAEDIAQEAFMTIWRKHKELKVDQSFNSYLFTITYNAIKKHFRKKRMKRDHFELYFNSFTGIINDTNERIEYNDLVNRVENLVDAFPNKRKEVFRLSREGNLTNQEIADKLNLSKKTVENHITTSLKSLRESLDLFSFFIACLVHF